MKRRLLSGKIEDVHKDKGVRPKQYRKKLNQDSLSKLSTDVHLVASSKMDHKSLVALEKLRRQKLGLNMMKERKGKYTNRKEFYRLDNIKKGKEAKEIAHKKDIGMWTEKDQKRLMESKKEKRNTKEPQIGSLETQIGKYKNGVLKVSGADLKAVNQRRLGKARLFAAPKPIQTNSQKKQRKAKRKKVRKV